jgi:hypothetical protein
MILRFTLAWIPMVFIAIMNGALRDLGYGKNLSELRAHQVSTVSAIRWAYSLSSLRYIVSCWQGLSTTN